MVLFDTEAGEKCLTFAVISLVIGISGSTRCQN